MHYITKEVTFDMAHMLTGHEGLCKNVHGHTYKLEVVLKSPNVISEPGEDIRPDEGMLLDFKELKKVLSEHITDKYDHSFVYWNESKEECRIANLLGSMNKKVVGLPFRTTAENMSKDMFEKLEPVIKALQGNCVLHEIKLWETPTSCAVYGRE